MNKIINKEKLILLIRSLKIFSKREITYLKLILFKSSLPIFTQVIWLIFSKLTRIKNLNFKSSLLRNGFIKNGYADLGHITKSDTKKIKELINPHFEKNDKPLKILPRKNYDLLAIEIFKFLKKFYYEIYSIFGADFQSFCIDVQKTTSSEFVDKDSSFAWHYDDEPSQMIKVFLYLNDTTKQNGAFRTFNRKVSRSLFFKKFISNTREDRIRSQKLVKNNIAAQSTWIERNEGSLFCFDNSLIHKATYPIKGERIIISIMLYPSFSELTLENIRKSLSLDLSSLQFPDNPWRNPYR